MDKLHHFISDISHISLPLALNSPFEYEPHPLAIKAAEQLQHYLLTQREWQHNFGLNPNDEDKAIGKMFGVLVVQTENKEIGFLCAFSGKLADANHHSHFVPPIYDSLDENEFLNKGMRALKVINDEIRQIVLEGCKATHKLMMLKEKRKGEGEVTSLLTKANGTLDIQLEISNEKALQLKNMIENAGVSSFYIGKKGLAYVDSLRL